MSPRHAARSRRCTTACARRIPDSIARLLIRAGDGSRLQTWMETYALPGSADGIDASLEAGIEAEAASWSHLVSGSRHVEAFIAAGDD